MQICSTKSAELAEARWSPGNESSQSKVCLVHGLAGSGKTIVILQTPLVAHRTCQDHHQDHNGDATMRVIDATTAMPALFVSSYSTTTKARSSATIYTLTWFHEKTPPNPRPQCREFRLVCQHIDEID